MPGLLTRALAGFPVIAALGTAIAPSAQAAPACQQIDPATGQCLVWVQVPGSQPTHGGTDEPAGAGSGAACVWDPAKQGLSGPPAGPVACSSEYGYWSNQYNCYISPLKPQPPADDPAWQGHEPGEGAVYQCFQPQTGILVPVWAADTPPGSDAGPTPGEVAQLAVDQMNLTAIDVGITPEPGRDSVGIVGMPVWLWVQAPDAQTYGPATASASAGGITVIATARVQQITWDMGDGDQVVCQTPGTPYQPSYGDQASPDCGHLYTESSAGQPGGRYTVTATSDWVVTWQGAGQEGTIELDGLASSVQITVGEGQVLVQ
jgi:hypothetical protein